MRTSISLIALLTLTSGLVAAPAGLSLPQDPEKKVVQDPKPKPDPDKTKQDPKGKGKTSGEKKQDPKKSGGEKKGDPKEQDPKGKGGDEKKQDPKEKDPKKGDDEKVVNEDEIQIPATADPADIRAIRAANQMLSAERRLQRMLKNGEIKGLDKVLTFDEISAWPYEDGLKGMPKDLKKLDGKKVMMVGFMLPIDEVENIKEFLLVQSLWSCCYGQPPDINGIVRVVMPGKKRTDYFFDPLKIIGTFKVEATVLDGYCVDIYQIEVESLEAIK